MVREGNPDRVLWDVLLDKQGDTGDCWPIASLLILARKQLRAAMYGGRL